MTVAQLREYINRTDIDPHATVIMGPGWLKIVQPNDAEFYLHGGGVFKPLSRLVHQKGARRSK